MRAIDRDDDPPAGGDDGDHPGGGPVGRVVPPARANPHPKEV